jgi:peptidoglycan biosynthesis protein MviN/MurJ (putative lipid II flippase)
MNILVAAGNLATFSSTISSTLLIVYQIYHSLSQQNDYSKRRFLHIVDVLVQSAVMYALALLVVAIVEVFITSGQGVTLPMFVAISYGAAIVYFVSVRTLNV